MSNPDSFIDEVTEEVRRDKLFGYLRRYGWIGILAVFLLVGGAAYREYRLAAKQADSEAFGDAVLDALDQDDPAARSAALAAVDAPGQRRALLGLLQSSDPETDKAAALAALALVAGDATLPASYRDLAVLRRVIVAGADLPAEERRALLEPIAQPGRPYRTLALEQLALLLVETGDPAAAITALEALRQDQEATAGLRRRAGQMIVALGGKPATN
ncbi:MAG: hypothetical protein IOC80_15075 [Rhodobacter sp.]|nr:hypothetical protein [Rhodobacter sp.]MCA3512698.1 hypothetical protein [Rhodobacter sp.]MCA3519786.1 hypothetical protein [Rhodobacter sp.]MCA3522565.1 hypothetical protein [Rhodobacter sp.]MCA3524984.1 hypothetical protein [Rhodobacter sp.]